MPAHTHSLQANTLENLTITIIITTVDILRLPHTPKPKLILIITPIIILIRLQRTPWLTTVRKHGPTLSPLLTQNCPQRGGRRLDLHHRPQRPLLSLSLLLVPTRLLVLLLVVSVGVRIQQERRLLLG
jgi:hypothetical protein